MRLLFLSSFLLLSALVSRAGDFESEKWVPPFRVTESTVDNKLIPQQCQAHLSFYFGDTTYAGHQIYMSINGLIESFTLANSEPVVYDLTPGKYVFKIWGGPGYQEIVTDSIEFAPQTVNRCQARIESAMEPVMVFKPVIYIHTDEAKDISVAVRPVGEFTFTYPDISKGWNGKVNSDGSIVVNGVSYPYLFWESNQQYSYKPSDNGFKVSRNEMITFLEKKSAEFGFTRQETTDFITFWGPKLTASESVFIQFTVDEACTQFADLTITPSPDQVKRVYIQFTEWNSAMQPYLQEKTFDKIADGFTVLEWGGFSFSVPTTAFSN